MGIPLRRGRPFAGTDRAGAPPVVMVDESLAARFWPNQDPVGKRLQMAGEWREVIGVTGHVKTYGAIQPSRIQAYLPYAQFARNNMALIVRTTRKPEELHAAVARQIQSLDSDLAIYNVRTMPELVSASLARQRFSMQLLTAFAALALLLSAVGIYGVIAYSVSQRSQEMGIRMALGAARGHVLRLVIGQGMAMVAVGLCAGLAAAASLTKLGSTLLHGVSPTDTGIFILMPLFLLVVALVSCYLPARRATHIGPMITLRIS